MTRTEFIAETAARLLASGTWQPDGARDEAIAMCDALERCGCAPRQTPAPALTDAARRVVEAAVAHHAIFKDSMVSDEGRELANAVRAYKESL